MKNIITTNMDSEERTKFVRDLARALAKKIANDNYVAEIAHEESSS